MELYVIFAQRKERYEGEHGLEALAVASEYDYDQNPEYINDTLAQNKAEADFVSVALVKLFVPEGDVRAVLSPENKLVHAKVVASDA